MWKLSLREIIVGVVVAVVAVVATSSVGYLSVVKINAAKIDLLQKSADRLERMYTSQEVKSGKRRAELKKSINSITLFLARKNPDANPSEFSKLKSMKVLPPHINQLLAYEPRLIHVKSTDTDEYNEKMASFLNGLKKLDLDQETLSEFATVEYSWDADNSEVSAFYRDIAAKVTTSQSGMRVSYEYDESGKFIGVSEQQEKLADWVKYKAVLGYKP